MARPGVSTPQSSAAAATPSVATAGVCLLEAPSRTLASSVAAGPLSRHPQPAALPRLRRPPSLLPCPHPALRRPPPLPPPSPAPPSPPPPSPPPPSPPPPSPPPPSPPPPSPPPPSPPPPSPPPPSPTPPSPRPPSPAPPPSPSPPTSTTCTDGIETFNPGAGGVSSSSTYGVAFDDDDNAYYASYGSKSVLKVTPAGEVSVFREGFVNSVNGIARDPTTGNFWVGGFGTGTANLLLLSPTGANLSTFDMPGTNRAMASRVDSSGAVYYAMSEPSGNNYSIRKRSQAGVETILVTSTVWNSFSASYGIIWMDIDPVAGFIYAEPWTSSGGLPIQRFNLDGTNRFQLPTTGLLLPNGQVRDWQGIGVNPATGTLLANYYDWTNPTTTWAWANSGTSNPVSVTDTLGGAGYLFPHKGYLYGGKNLRLKDGEATPTATFRFWGAASGLAVAPDGRMFATDWASGLMFVAAPAASTANGFQQSVFLSGLDRPGEICGIHNGALFFLASAGTKIHKVDLTTKEVTAAVDDMQFVSTACCMDASGSGALVYATGEEYIGTARVRVYVVPPTTAFPVDEGNLRFTIYTLATHVISGMAADLTAGTVHLFVAGEADANGMVSDPAVVRVTGTGPDAVEQLYVVSDAGVVGLYLGEDGEPKSSAPMYVGGSLALTYYGDLYIDMADPSYEQSMTQLSGANTVQASDVPAATTYFGGYAAYGATRFSVVGGTQVYTARDGYVLRVCGAN